VTGGGSPAAEALSTRPPAALPVALLEQSDYASGTSCRSSKLIHRGLRSLEQRRFGLVREALRERGLLLPQLCLHLVRPVSFLFLLTHRVWERLHRRGNARVTLLAPPEDELKDVVDKPNRQQATKNSTGQLALAPGLQLCHLPDLLPGRDHMRTDGARFRRWRTAARNQRPVICAEAG
jgi:glycerol-3-phosphate dehydrogenase